jgi:transglutaminase-like putative cysteine protease
MKRRTLLKAAPAAGLLAATPWAAHAQSSSSDPQGWRTFEVVTRLEITPPTGQVVAWVPLPLMQKTDWFESLSNSTTGNAEHTEVFVDPVYGAGIVYARFKAGEAQPMVEATSRFRTRDRFVAMRPGGSTEVSAQEQALYLKGTDLMPTDGIVRETAQKITKGSRSDVEKARAIYDWVVENTERNPKTRGCGVGDVKAMLETGTLNGKCADLNAMFVALCRAVGVPARDVYGIRVAASPRGFKSMGRAGDISKAQHCRAEFYAQGFGWIPVDPADVRKVILEEKPGLTLNDDIVKQARTMLWGGWEGNWLGYNTAHDVRLPGSSRAPVPFLMYPQAENAQGRLDSLDPETFKYKITSKEITA